MTQQPTPIFKWQNLKDLSQDRSGEPIKLWDEYSNLCFTQPFYEYLWLHFNQTKYQNVVKLTTMLHLIMLWLNKLYTLIIICWL